MKSIIQLGETLRLYLNYTDVDTGAPIDPPVLTCSVRKPDSTVEVITYPDANFTREDVGSFFVRVLGDQIGTWRYRIYAQTSINDFDVRDGIFDVEPSL